LEKKVALCGANKMAVPFLEDYSTVKFTVPKTNLFGFQPKPPWKSAPVAKLQTNSKMTLWMTESAKVERLLKEPGISTQDNDTVLLYKRAVVKVL
jgi:hypothetical protein